MSEEKHETHAEIIAEVRFHAQQNIDAEKGSPTFGILTMEGKIAKDYADRLEAAHERELAIKDAVIQTESAARLAEQERHKREVEALKRQLGNTAKRSRRAREGRFPAMTPGKQKKETKEDEQE